MSPVGLSKITDLSPKRIVAFMMGVWFLSSAYAFQLVGFIGKQLAIESDSSNIGGLESLGTYIGGFDLISKYAIGAGLLVILTAPLLKKLMGDVQAYFVDQKVKNFYSISISGYHIAEAGANPITQLAFTLANGFTYIEYFLNRGLEIDDFIPNFSFFFSNGMDPEYAVIGRVARRIWAQTMKLKYKANSRSQKLK